MQKFKSNKEYFQAVRDFMTDLKESGLEREAEKVRHGFGLINGLTDGWNMYLEVLIELESEKPSVLSPAQHQRLTELIDAAEQALTNR
jgi:hypothetical protein